MVLSTHEKRILMREIASDFFFLLKLDVCNNNYMEKSNDVFVSFSFKDRDIVEKIVNTLDKKYGLKVWVCTEKLNGGHRYFKEIPPAIRDSKTFLYVFSKSSSSSEEVSREVEIAIKADIVIIPFIIDNTEIENSDAEYFIVDLNYIDGTVPTFKKRLKELSHSIASWLNKRGDTTHLKIKIRDRLLPSKKVFPTKTYVGREDIAKAIDDAFDDGHHLIFLSGIGGIGKTQIAKKYAFDHRDDYETIIFATYEGDIERLIINETPFAFEPEMMRKMKKDGQLETDDEFFKRKLEKIKNIASERTLIIIDNLDDPYREEFNEFFDGPYRLIITTRNDYSSSEYSQIKIAPLTDEKELKKLFFNNYSGDMVLEDDPHLIDLIKLVNNHTYTITLLAKHMSNSCQTVEEMIEALKKEGILSLNEEVETSEMSTSIAYQNLLKMYNLSNLSDAEINALRFLLFVPNEGVSSYYLKLWGGEEILKTIRELEKRSWVIRSASNSFVLHPIVYQIVKNNIKVDYPTCKSFLDNYGKLITHESPWSFKKVTKEAYASFAYKILEFFPNIFDDIEELYYDIEMLLSFAVNPQYAVKLAEKQFEYYKNKNGLEDFYTARSAYKVGWNYIFNSELPHSLENAQKWILLSFSLLEKVTRPLTTYEKISYYNIARHVSKTYQYLFAAYHKEEDYEKAIYYASWALDKLNKEDDEELKNNRLGSMNIQVSDVYLVHKEYEKALYYEQEAERTSGPNNTDILYHRTRKAKCFLGLKKYQQALDIANECLFGYIERDGKFNTNTLDTYSIMLSCYQALGNKDKAKECETEIANIRKVLFA